MSTPTRLHLHRPSSNSFSYSPARRKVQATNTSRSSWCHPRRAARPPWGPRRSPQPRHPVLQPQPEGTAQQWALPQDQALVCLLSPPHTPHAQSHQLPAPEEHGAHCTTTALWHGKKHGPRSSWYRQSRQGCWLASQEGWRSRVPCTQTSKTKVVWPPVSLEHVPRELSCSQARGQQLPQCRWTQQPSGHTDVPGGHFPAPGTQSQAERTCWTHASANIQGLFSYPRSLIANPPPSPQA